MLHKSKGKYKWQTKATYSVEWSLDPVILAYLEKLYDTIKDRETIGIPIDYCKKQAALEGKEYNWETGIDLDAAHQLRLRDLEELICIFNKNNEPNMDDYDFTYKDEWGEFKIPLVCTNLVERERYAKDCNDWYERVKAGKELFGRIYNTLDW